MRRGEVFGLAWGRVDLNRGRVRVEQALHETDGAKAREVEAKRWIGPPKSKSARREVPLPPFATAALRRHRKALGATPLPGVLVFATASGSPVRFSNFTRRHYKPLVERAGIPDATFHALRHTSATLMLGSGVDVKTAQAVLGHAKASHTLDLYADSIPGNLDTAMAAFGALVESAGKE